MYLEKRKFWKMFCLGEGKLLTQEKDLSGEIGGRRKLWKNIKWTSSTTAPNNFANTLRAFPFIPSHPHLAGDTRVFVLPPAFKIFICILLKSPEITCILFDINRIYQKNLFAGRKEKIDHRFIQIWSIMIYI